MLSEPARRAWALGGFPVIAPKLDRAGFVFPRPTVPQTVPGVWREGAKCQRQQQLEPVAQLVEQRTFKALQRIPPRRIPRKD